MMNNEPFRLQPAMPVEAYKTYAILSPPSTHTRIATCEEVECEHWRNGWSSTIDTATQLGKQQAAYIQKHSGRKYTVTIDGYMICFRFRAGQKCFREHRVSIDRPPLYIVRDGDWRGNPTGVKRQHASARDWVDDFGEHQQNIADQIEKG